MSTLTPTTAASIDYFQHLGVEETITRLFHIFGRRWGVFLAITAIAYLLITAISIVSMVVILPLVIQSSQKTSADWYNSNYDDRSTFYIHWIMFSLVNSAIYYAVMCIADGALIRAVAEIYLDHVPTVYDTLLNGLHKLGPLFCTAFLIGAFVGIPAVAIVFIILKAWGSVPAAVLFGVFFAAFVICVTVFTYLAYPIIMVENLGPVTCVFRSFELSFGHRCYIFSILLLFFFAQFVISSLVSSLASHDDYHAYIVSRTLKLVLNIFFASLGSMYVPRQNIIMMLKSFLPLVWLCLTI